VIAAALHPPERHRDVPQGLIARRMPVLVVQRLELVEVEDE